MIPMLDDEMDITVLDERALNALGLGRIRRKKSMSPLPSSRSAPGISRITRLSVSDETANAMREGIFALMRPVARLRTVAASR